MRPILLVLLLVATVAGCTTRSGQTPGAQAGLSPSVAGPPAATASVPPPAPTIAMGSGLVAGSIGADLSRRERAQALEAEYRALEYTPAGQVVTWGDQASGRYGEVVAATPYRVGSQDCRQYGHTVHVGGEEKKARGTACRNPDGSWSPLT